MSQYNKHPAVVAVKDRHFSYSPEMYPFQFKYNYYKLPVTVASGDTIEVCATRYMSGHNAARQAARQAWRRAVMKHYDKEGWDDLFIKDWMESELGRQGAIFFGHGLPEEISLVCQLAMSSGYKSRYDVGDWAHDCLGLDCNGFVNAYLTSLGTFSGPHHYHPEYPQLTRAIKNRSEITYDNVIVTASNLKKVKTDEDLNEDGKENDYIYEEQSNYHVKRNPNEEGAHILVIDFWAEKNKSFWATDQRSKNDPGPLSNIWHIVKEPKTNSGNWRKYVWKIRKDGTYKTKEVYITGRMQKC